MFLLTTRNLLETSIPSLRGSSPNSRRITVTCSLDARVLLAILGLGAVWVGLFLGFAAESTGQGAEDVEVQPRLVPCQFSNEGAGGKGLGPQR